MCYREFKVPNSIDKLFSFN
uniref:Uncharacterized protein n=1 Tax=Rhizophora mucronata TaxID=61149 RepID=A0A2P2INI4_RHIMU